MVGALLAGFDLPHFRVTGGTVEHLDEMNSLRAKWLHEQGGKIPARGSSFMAR